jgi:hypothetical protein
LEEALITSIVIPAEADFQVSCGFLDPPFAGVTKQTGFSTD